MKRLLTRRKPGKILHVGKQGPLVGRRDIPRPQPAPAPITDFASILSHLERRVAALEAESGPSAAPTASPAPVESEGQCLDWRTFDPASLDDGSDGTLIPELIAYQANLDRLLEHQGEFDLIKGSDIVGCYPTLAAALDEGAERFGEEPALVKEIVAVERARTSGGLVG